MASLPQVQLPNAWPKINPKTLAAVAISPTLSCIRTADLPFHRATEVEESVSDPIRNIYS